MEAHFVHSGALVLKFWLQIDKDEQERRFNDRMKNPEKRWKITDEDWRNREKWDAYVLAVNEMLEKTCRMCRMRRKKSLIRYAKSMIWI